MSDEALPRVTVLYAENVKDKIYYPLHAAAALKDKAVATFVPLSVFQPSPIAAAVLELQLSDRSPHFIAVDIPNDTPCEKVNDIAYAVRAMGDRNSRRVVFGTTKNQIAQQKDFYEQQRIPVIEWKNLKACAFNSDEILRQQNKKPKKIGILEWISRALDGYGPYPPLHI